MKRLLIAFGVYLSLVSAPFKADAAELVYFGSSACSVCEMWNEEVGEIYPKTEEAHVLPLRYHDVHDKRPDDLAFIKRVIYTPTFVAIEDGRELGRIVGYMGDFFFWEQVGGLIQKVKPVESVRNENACKSSSSPTVPSSC